MSASQVRRTLALARRWLGRESQAAPARPNWHGLLSREGARWKAARRRARGGPRLLLGTSMGGYTPGVTIESMLAVALTLRGVDVETLLCDGALPGCQQAQIGGFDSVAEFVAEGPRRLCEGCYRGGRAPFAQLEIPVHTYGGLLREADRAWASAEAGRTSADQIPQYRLGDLPVGEHALAGALRFFARGTLEGEALAEPVLRRFFEAGLRTALGVQRLAETRPFQRALLHHGIYVPQGMVAEALRCRSIPITTWTIAYRKSCFIFSHDDTYHHTLLSEPVEQWEGIPYSAELDSALMDYLKSRWQGTRDWIWFHEKPEEQLSAIAAEIGVDFSKPCIGLLTNVMWDAQLHYRANAFPNMLEWVLATIRYFAQRPELQLLIRIHPAEVRGSIPSRQPLLDELATAFPQLPPNVFVIPPASQVSTYAAMLQCDSVLIYGTKTGVELTSLGIPVVVAGEAWIRNKGITRDAASPEDYRRLLDTLPVGRRMDEDQTARARRYAFHFFFRRMIPLPFVQPVAGWPPFELKIDSLDDLMPGRHPGLDVICEGLQTGAPFVFPAETMPVGDWT